jgi:nitrite reductase/ring-hydroxylating ferredoxin subunit
MSDVVNEAAWQKLDGLDPETSKFPARAKVDGEGIIIIQAGAGFRGIQRSCPHLQATLLDAHLMANNTMVRCAQHNYTFKLSDGKGVNCPGFRIKVYEVKREDGALFARAVA